MNGTNVELGHYFRQHAYSFPKVTAIATFVSFMRLPNGFSLASSQRGKPTLQRRGANTRAAGRRICERF
jgi:hypothetical protein